jgi:CO/xanthine dehydrogenase Mo-binding subunit
VPSKWEDAEKWLRQPSDQRGHHHAKAASKQHHNGGGLVQRGAGAEEEKAPATARRTSLDANALALYTPPAEVLLKGELELHFLFCIHPEIQCLCSSSKKR